MDEVVDGLAIVLIILLVLAVVALLIGFTQRNRSKQGRERSEAPQAPKDPFADEDTSSIYGDPRKLRAGDIVEIHGQPYTVRGSLHLDEGGWTWAEHLLDDAKDTQVWLSVEEDPDLMLSLWTDLDTEVQPGPKSIEVEGRRYKLEEKGKAAFRSEATTGLAEGGEVRYYDYESDDGAMLGFESYADAEWEASTGQSINQQSLRIYPTSQNA